MNKENAADSFNENIYRLSRLPLITDQEIGDLFGEEVAAVLDQLSIIDRKENLCSTCRDKCCRFIRCELFSSRFDRCPIHELRPALCRLHYCAKFHPEDGALIKELGDIFFYCLTEAQGRGITMVKWFDSPLLAEGCPGLVSVAAPWVDAVEKGALDPTHAAQLILKEAEKHRRPET